MPLKKIEFKETKKKSAYKLRGLLPAGSRVLNKSQIAMFDKAKKKLNKTKTKIPVQLHRNEKILSRAQNTAYVAIMKKAKLPYKK